jgi:fumarate reductase subunit D
MVDVARHGSAPSGASAEPGSDGPAAPSASAAGNALRLLATVGSPIAIATGLLFYFGWVRASVQARRLGYDTAILDWSVQDYILRSILVLFIPLMVLAALMLLLIRLHQRLVLPIADSGRLATWLPRGLRGSWLLWASAAVVLSVLAAPLSGIIVSAAVTLALLCALYGDLLERRLTGRTRTSSAARVLLLVLLAFAVFWNVERLAHVVGEEYAAQITANPRQLLAVTVYTPKSLELHVPGVVETKLGSPESAYRYRYDGLRLVQRSGNRYLLMSEHWDARTSRIIVLRDTDDIRMEFTR